MANDGSNGARRNVWTKGMPSPNPGGRTRGVERTFRDELDKLAKEAGFDDGLRALIRKLWQQAMTGEPRESFAAMQLLLDRGWGRAKQILDVTFDDESVVSAVDWSRVPLERRRRLEEALREVAELEAAAETDDEIVEH